MLHMAKPHSSLIIPKLKPPGFFIIQVEVAQRYWYYILTHESSQFIFKLTFSHLIIQHTFKLAIILHYASCPLILHKIIINPYHVLVLLDYFLVINDHSSCSLCFHFHINYIIALFTIISNRYKLSEYSFIVFLVFPGLSCRFLYLLFLSPTLSIIFWLLFNSFSACFLSSSSGSSIGSFINIYYKI